MEVLEAPVVFPEDLEIIWTAWTGGFGAADECWSSQSLVHFFQDLFLNFGGRI